MDWQDIKEESDWRAKAEIPTADTRSIQAKCEAGTFPIICMESSIRKRPSWTCTNKLWLGKGRSFELTAISHNIRRRCSCTYGCTQSNQVRLCNGSAMRNCQVHVCNCSNVMHHFLWVSWNGRVLQQMDKKGQRYRRRREQWQWWRRPVWWLNCFEGVIHRVCSTYRECNSSFSHMP